MPPTLTSPPVKERLLWAAIGLGLKALALVLMRIAKKDAWLARALNQSDGIYRFESGDRRLSAYLVFQAGQALARREWPTPPNFTFTLFNPSGLGLNLRSENVLEVVIGNKVGQSGNLYYVYQFGFIMSLLERYFKLRRLKPKAAADKNLWT